MHPILVDLTDAGSSLRLGSYGLFLALGVALATFGAAWSARRARLDVGLAFAVMACAIGGGFAGAWLTFVLVELARTGELHAGGIVFFGAVPGGALAALVASRVLRFEWLRALDLSIPTLAAGHALGRVGCFLAGCCYGRAFDGAWSVVYEHPLAPAAVERVPRHPAPLYEALGLLALAAIFALAPARRPGRGHRALAYLGAYAALRIVTELFRGDAVRGVWLGLASTSQLIAAAALVAAVALLARARLAERAMHD